MVEAVCGVPVRLPRAGVGGWLKGESVHGLDRSAFILFANLDPRSDI